MNADVLSAHVSPYWFALLLTALVFINYDDGIIRRVIFYTSVFTAVAASAQDPEDPIYPFIQIQGHLCVFLVLLSTAYKMLRG